MADPVVYAIEHTESGKKYVGSTNSWARRLTEHRSELRGGRHCNHHLQKSWTKHGEAAFTFTVLEHLADTQHIIEREQHWIDTLGAATAGFNMCPAAGTRRGVPHSPEHRAKLAAANTGKTRTEAAKVLIRAARAKQVITPESTQKTRAKNIGMKRDAAFCARISEAQTGKTKSAEHRAKLADANRGKVTPAEVKAKQSAALKAYWERRKSTQHVTDRI